jgi:hypothetical protein
MGERPGSSRRTLALSVSAAALVSAVTFGAAGGIAAPSRLAVPAQAPRCRTSRLVVWLDTQGNGAAGSTYYKLQLTNLSGRACTLFGYPGVSGVDLAGRRLGSPASRNPVRPPRLVTLANRATATAVLQIVDAYNYPRSRCRPTEAAGLRVFPPNQTASKLVPFPYIACARSGPVYLTTQAVRRA